MRRVRLKKNNDITNEINRDENLNEIKEEENYNDNHNNLNKNQIITESIYKILIKMHYWHAVHVKTLHYLIYIKGMPNAIFQNQWVPLLKSI